MSGKLFVFLCFAACYQLSRALDSCFMHQRLSGEISSETVGSCWIIDVPMDHFALLQINRIRSSRDCSVAVDISIPKTHETYTYCNDLETKTIITALSHVLIKFTRKSYTGYGPYMHLNYTIEDILCLRDDIFRCSPYSCILSSQVCDGESNCEDGQDEIGCEKGIMAIKGVEEVRRKTISRLKNKKISSWGWREDTHRAIVALYLASGVTFNGNSLEEELMVKQLELKTSLTLLRRNIDTIRPVHLSMFVNSLLVTCLNPHYFYGYDLVKMLKEQVQAAPLTVHPAAYLALCNAKENLNEATPEILLKILNNDSEYPFILDMKAFALMALSCLKSRTENTSIHFHNGSASLDSYTAAVNSLKSLQQQDGSFGNVYTTALVIQALLASGQENSKDWNLEKSINYLLNQLNSSPEDFLAIDLILPILNSKSLADIAKVNCTKKNKAHREDMKVENINDKLGPKIYIQYFLSIGDDLNIVHTISLVAAENVTVLEIMKLAEAADLKYKFKWKHMSGKLYIYEIANITNDPEAGKYWILYWTGGNQNGTFSISTESPENLILEDGDQLLMWYQTAEFWNQDSKNNTAIKKSLIYSPIPYIASEIPAE